MSIYIPIGLFICIVSVMVILVFVGLKTTGIISIFSSLLSIMLAFINSKIVVNGSLIQNIGGIDGSNNIVQGVTPIEIPALSYIFIFTGLFMVVILAVQVLREVEFRKSKDIVELDI